MDGGKESWIEGNREEIGRCRTKQLQGGGLVKGLIATHVGKGGTKGTNEMGGYEGTWSGYDGANVRIVDSVESGLCPSLLSLGE